MNGLLCINYEQLRAMNAVTGSYKLSLLLGRIGFQVGKTKIEKLGKKVIARTVKQLADYAGACETTASAQLKQLSALNLIETRTGMWFGNKRTFISCREDLTLRVNAKKLELMNRYTGSDMASITLSLFAYFLQKNPLHYKDGDWVMVARDQVTSLFNISDRTAREIAWDLEARGLIKVKTCRGWGKAQFLVKINDDFYNKIDKEWVELKEANRLARIAQKLAKVEKSEVSIRIKKERKIEIINNNTLIDQDGTIILSTREQNYLVGALKRTMARAKGVKWDIAALLSQLRYALSSPQQRKGTQSFVHAINRAMLLIREGRWKMPFGYEKYSSVGKAEHDGLREREKAHYQQKDPRALSRLLLAGDVPSDLDIDIKPVKEPETPCAAPEDEERKRKMADLERRWSESRYGR